MKRLHVLMAVLMMTMPITAAAESTTAATVALEMPAGFVQQVCPAPVWKDVPVQWKGITDARQDKVVGVQTKKGQEPVEVTASPALDASFDRALRKLLAGCGMRFVDKADGETLKLSAEIKDFYAGVEKKLVTGKALAHSTLSFMADKGIKSITIDVGTELESKDIRKGDIKGLTKALDQLFIETLKRIPSTSQMQELR